MQYRPPAAFSDLFADAAAAIGASILLDLPHENLCRPGFRSFRRHSISSIPMARRPNRCGEVLRWQFGGGRQRAIWPEWAPSPHADTPPPRVDGDKVRFSFVGHASFLIQTAGLNVLVDPVWSQRASPVQFRAETRQRSGHRVCALPAIDVVLVSHGHYDHLDLVTLSRLAAI